MKTCMNMATRTAGLLLALLFLVRAADAAPYVILQDGRKVEGTDIRAKANGDIVLVRAQGPVTFAKDQIKMAVADKPPQMDAIVRAVQAGQFDKAIPELEKVIEAYDKLYWDGVAMDYLGRAQAGKGEASTALGTYGKLERKYPDALNGDAKWGYFQALISAKKYSDLENKLKDVIASGTRTEAAQAQILRGDARAAQGDRKGAAINYLRTVIFFKAVDEAQPQALYKAGLALEQMKDPRAKDQFKALLETYPDSAWAAKVRNPG